MSLTYLLLGLGALYLLTRLFPAASGPRGHTPESFARAAADAVARARPDCQVSVTPELAVLIVLPGGADAVWNLSNAWMECSVPEADVDEVLARYVKSITEGQAMSGRARNLSDVVPIVRPEGYVAETLRASEGKLKIAFRPLAADLVLAFAFDGPNSLLMVSEDDVAEFDLTLDALLARSLETLRARRKPIMIEGEGPLYMATCGGDFEASLLLEDEFWERAARKVPGDIALVVPARDLLLFASAADPAAVERLRTAAADLHAKCPRPFSLRVLRRTADGRLA